MMEFLKVAGIAVALLAFIGLIIYGAIHGIDVHAEWVASCEAQGGRVDEVRKTSTGTGVSTNGKPVVTTSTQTTYYCLSADGRILDIR